MNRNLVFIIIFAIVAVIAFIIISRFDRQLIRGIPEELDDKIYEITISEGTCFTKTCAILDACMKYDVNDVAMGIGWDYRLHVGHCYPKINGEFYPCDSKSGYYERGTPVAVLCEYKWLWEGYSPTYKDMIEMLMEKGVSKEEIELAKEIWG